MDFERGGEVHERNSKICTSRDEENDTAGKAEEMVVEKDKRLRTKDMRSWD